MKISGFTIVRNAIINDYPVLESIRSILPVVDEMIVAVGDSQDDTGSLITSLSSDKIRVVHSCWDHQLRKGGEVLALETDKAMREISVDSDRIFYIQADEVLHEKFQQLLISSARIFLNDPQTEALLFDFIHFYGNYDYVADSRKWYSKEVRFFRNNIGVHAYRDAQGFRKQQKKLKVQIVPITIYHYGWVKTPVKMKEKLKHTHQFWEQSDSPGQRAAVEVGESYDFSVVDSLDVFVDSHPAVMRRRIGSFTSQVRLNIRKKQFSFLGRLLYWFEKGTGVRPFDYKNYKIL